MSLLEQIESLEETISSLKKQNVSVCALETGKNINILDKSLVENKSFALVLGNERFGLNSRTQQLCDHVFKIPTTGRKNSLNVSVAVGIALSHFCV